MYKQPEEHYKPISQFGHQSMLLPALSLRSLMKAALPQYHSSPYLWYFGYPLLPHPNWEARLPAHGQWTYSAARSEAHSYLYHFLNTDNIQPESSCPGWYLPRAGGQSYHYTGLSSLLSALPICYPGQAANQMTADQNHYKAGCTASKHCQYYLRHEHPPSCLSDCSAVLLPGTGNNFP